MCDGCGLCCLRKFIDEETDETIYTCIVCRYFDNDTCRCRDYAKRCSNVPDCVRLTPENVGEIDFLPDTCAYRLLASGKKLHWWHPLVSGSKDSVHRAGISIKDKTISERHIHLDDLDLYSVREDS